MRSSGSTPNPSREPPFPLYLVVAHEDNPRACTGRRLLRRGLAQPLELRGRRADGLLLLDPFASTPLCRADRTAGLRGLVAVDCSWNRLSVRGEYPRDYSDLVRNPRRRRLPWLLAGNAQHYGRLGFLNTAEALAAAAYLLGDSARAERILDSTAAGGSFLELNRQPLERYRKARSEAEVRTAEREFF